MEVYDFTQMYTQFMPHDMKLQLAACINDIFAYQSGASIITSAGDFGRRGGIRKAGDVKLTLLLKYAPGLTKGMQLVDSIRWSNLDVGAAMQGVRVMHVLPYRVGYCSILIRIRTHTHIGIIK